MRLTKYSNIEVKIKKIGTYALLMNNGSTPFSANLGGDSK